MALDTAAAKTQYEGLLMPLKGYHSLLRQSVDPPAAPKTTHNPLGIAWLKTKDGHRITREVLNGLELFALLAQVDWDVWSQQATEIWEDPKLQDFGDNNPVRVGVDVNPVMKGRVEPVFEILATSGDNQTQTPDVVKAREIVKQILHDRGEVLTEVPVRVAREGQGPLKRIIFKVMQTVTRPRLSDATTGDHYHGLRVRFFIPNLALIALSALELQHLAAIAAAGVAIDDVGTIKPEAHLPHPEMFTKSLWTLLAIGASPTALVRERGVKNVVLTSAFQAAMVPSIYSAIAASASVQSVTIDPAIDTKTPKKYCQKVWPWIGFTLFCHAPNNTHALQALTLNVNNLKVADVNAIRDVISADDPIAKLFARAPSYTTEAISASRFVLSDPTTKRTDANTAIVESAQVLTDLPVLKKSKEWTTVLLPAWGHARVHQDDVVAKHRWAKGPFPVKMIARLELELLNHDSKDAVMALLQLVGGGVKQLLITADDNVSSGSTFDDWLAQAINACPNLEVLELEQIPIGSLQFLVDAYESGNCRLTRFQTTGKDIMTCEESVRRLFVALGDRTHPAARYLSEFHCNPVTIAAVSDPILVATAVGMLAKNERLQDFELGFLCSVMDNTNFRRFPAFIEPFKAFDKQKISRALAPLDVCQRIAFLSVVTPYVAQKNSRDNHERRPRAVEKLDACVLSLIFKMAATCCERRVHFGIRYGWF